MKPKGWGVHCHNNMALRTPTKGTYNRNMRESQRVKGLRSKLSPKETNSHQGAFPNRQPSPFRVWKRHGLVRRISQVIPCPSVSDGVGTAIVFHGHWLKEHSKNTPTRVHRFCSIPTIFFGVPIRTLSLSTETQNPLEFTYLFDLPTSQPPRTRSNKS